ncbi:MAG: hypothetical protein OES13_09375 [Acidimicrobiia bacterium]|nr:hypothetical protein [Acidimicrobiia bacterium]
MNTDPLSEIRRVERSVSMAVADARSEAATAIAEAKRRAEQLIAEASARGQTAAEQRYQDGLARARDEAEKILGDGDGRVAALRRQAETHLPAAVDLVMTMVLPPPEEG